MAGVIKAGQLEARREREQAVAAYERILALDPSDVGALYHKGNALMALGRYDQAEPYYKRSLTIWERVLGPKHPDLAYRSHEFFDSSLAPPFPSRTPPRPTGGWHLVPQSAS